MSATSAVPAPAMAGIHVSETPSSWVQRWSHLLKPAATVLDVACGTGRHMRWFSELGHHVNGVDWSESALAQARHYGEVVQADLEGGWWPFVGQRFDLVVVTNYLWRPLMPRLLQSLAADGLLLYETFADGQQTIGRPARPEFLLRHGELLHWCRSLRVIAYEDGFEQNRYVQRIAAARPPESEAGVRYSLTGATTKRPG